MQLAMLQHPRVFLKAKVIQALGQLRPDRDKLLNFPDQEPSSSNFSKRIMRNNLALQRKITKSGSKSSQNRFGAYLSKLDSPISTSLDIRCVHYI